MDPVVLAIAIFLGTIVLTIALYNVWAGLATAIFAIGLLSFLAVSVYAIVRKLCSKETWQDARRTGAAMQVRREENKRLRGAKERELIEGALRPKVICPHCQEKGGVRVFVVSGKNTSVDGGKVALAIFTGGLSVFGQGIEKTERFHHETAKCTKCQMKWTLV
jgi:hypothetical protein